MGTGLFGSRLGFGIGYLSLGKGWVRVCVNLGQGRLGFGIG